MPAISCNVKVLEHKTVAENIRLLTVTWPLRDVQPKAGQFFMLRCWPMDAAPLLSRPISVHRFDPVSATLVFLYEVKGIGTKHLAALEPGDALSLTGPSGNGFPVDKIFGRVAVVGGGIGTAPLYQLACELKDKGCPADVYLGFRDEVYGLEAFASAANNVFVATETGSTGAKGFVTGLLRPQNYDWVLCCGPDPMMRAVAKLCEESETTTCLVSLEKKMACGVGACLGCSCHTKDGGGVCVCKDGPVFNAQEVF